MGVPSVRSHNTNIFPKRRAQQHQKRWKSLTGPCSATSRSHRVETANLAMYNNSKEEKKDCECKIIHKGHSIFANRYPPIITGDICQHRNSKTHFFFRRRRRELEETAVDGDRF